MHYFYSMPALRGLLILIFFLLAACQGRSGKHTVLQTAIFPKTISRPAQRHSVYYWKTTYNGDSVSSRKLKEAGVTHIYIHYFDVDWSETLKIPVPVGQFLSAEFDKPGIDDIPFSSLPLSVNSYTPVVFITNRALEQMPDNWCDSLAEKLTYKISSQTNSISNQYHRAYLSRKYGISRYEARHQSLSDDSLKVLDIYSEIQIDCDWTAATKDKYFRILKKFKELNHGKIISATIRLYPYKYKDKMGVPPVDRGMLMCYNLGNIGNEATRNSIYDLEQLKLYMDANDYPLPLDIAFPAFGWHIWFRNGKLKEIVHSPIRISDYGSAFRKEGNRYFLQTDTVIGNNYYREGDELRAELPDEEDLLQGVALVTGKIPDYGRISFFDWSDLSTTKYENIIRKVFNRY